MNPVRLAVGLAFVGVGCYLMLRGPQPPADPAPNVPASPASHEATTAPVGAPATARLGNAPAEAAPVPVTAPSPSVPARATSRGSDAPVAPTSFADELLAEKTVLTNSLVNAGNETALAALQTLLWSLASDQAETYASMITWTWKERAWAEFASTPQPWMLQLGTPERLVAWGYVNDFATVGGVRLIDHRVFGPNDEEVRLRLLHEDGSATEEAFLLRRTAAGWQRQHVPTTVGNIAARLRGEKKPYFGR